MSFAPDLVLQGHIEQGLALVRSRPELVDEIFAGLTATQRDQIRAYVAGWSDPATRPEVRLGWVQATAKMPAIACTLPGEQEGGQYVGSEPGFDYDSDAGELIPSWAVEDGVYWEGQVAQFNGAVDAAIYALNATETTWIAAIVKWALLRYRPALEAAGLIEQRVSLTDFMPASDYPQPDPAYTRVVKLQYTAFLRYTLEDGDPDSLLEATDAIVINEADE